MSGSKDINNEDLKKLEDEAYFELCQIIAEALEYQDVELLDARIAAWKTKYKKLLDRPSTSSKSDFKKRIEYLLNQYYSQITQYILNKLKLKEEEKVKNQAKAMRELYRIIKDTNDLDLLKKKVNKWKGNYPVSGFLKMYQKRIELYTREKNLKENAFKQEEAFSRLVDITKMHRTIDELKDEVELWEKKYSINDKFTIDDFIKHQSEVKRFTSDEFLQSIARDDINSDVIDKNEIDLAEEYNNKPYSNLSVQANAYATLVAISRSPNNINEMFRWVYKNSHIKFNEKYKELILNSTYLEYSPTYLNKLSKPKLDMSKSSLSFDEYKNMNDIKRYAIISYFNLLLPPDKAISNDYFNKHIQVIYSKSERARVKNQIKDDSASIENVIDSGTEVPLILPDQNTDIDSSIQVEVPNLPDNDKSSYKYDTITGTDDKKLINVDDNSEANEINVGYEDPKSESQNSEDLDDTKESAYMEPEQNDSTLGLDTDKEFKPKTLPSEDLDTTNESTDTELEQSNSTLSLDTDKEFKPKTLPIEDLDTTKEPTDTEFEQSNSILNLDSDEETLFNDNPEPEFDYDTIVTLSPMFFSAINNYDKQAVLIDHIDSATTKFVRLEKSKSLKLDKPIKTKNNSD